jgi:AraC-like DNA-binding protein
LTRRFTSAIGMPPGEWLQRERLRLAQRLLERTADPIEVVARRSGYDAAVTMRAQLGARLRTSPRVPSDVPRSGLTRARGAKGLRVRAWLVGGHPRRTVSGCR